MKVKYDDVTYDKGTICLWNGSVMVATISIIDLLKKAGHEFEVKSEIEKVKKIYGDVK